MKPYEFLEYALFDTTSLFTRIDSKVISANKILKETFNIYEDMAMYTTFTIPTTIESFVKSIWDRYLKYKVWDTKQFIILAMVKHSIFNSKHKSYNKVIKYLEKINQIKCFNDLQEYEKNNSQEVQEWLKILTTPKVILYSPFETAGIKYLMNYSLDTKMGLLAMVCGGKANNERYKEYNMENVADIDL
jgi:hypothetical protein